MAILAVMGNNVRWRVFEHEMLNRHFGPIVGTKTGKAYEAFEKHKKDIDAIFWKPETEEMTEENYSIMMEQYGKIIHASCSNNDVFMINNPVNFMSSLCKDTAFKLWESKDINCPKWAYSAYSKDVENMINYPFILRLNNKTGGKDSILVNNSKMLHNAIIELHGQTKDINSLETKLIEVKFYETYDDKFFVRLSYRIIIAGNRIITGYARLCRPPEWVAITSGGKFDVGMWDAFKHYQKRCQKICEKHGKEILRAVHVLGLNFQGMDIIEHDGKLIFLEVQPGFSTGYANPGNGFRPPYYNPSYPPLVNLIKEHEDEMPDMYRIWLDKERMFDECFKALKESKNENH